MSQCSIEGCVRSVAGRGWCNLHWQRWSRTGDPTKVRKKPKLGRTIGHTWMHKGYKWIIAEDGRAIAEHRYVMELHLGRRLKTHELVHHKDEVKTNNHIDNLELLDFSEHTAHHRAHRMPCVACGDESQGSSNGLCSAHAIQAQYAADKYGIVIPKSGLGHSIGLMGVALSISSSEVEERLLSLKKK